MGSGVEDAKRASELGQRTLLARLGSHHRAAVARTQGLPGVASAREIASLFRDEAHLDELLDGLSRDARDLLTAGAFDRSGIALKLNSYAIEFRWLDGPSKELRRGEIAKTLERQGLLFAFADDEWYLAYCVPADLRPRLRRRLGARFARGARRAGARRWLDLTGQDLRDAVALWMHLARRPVPIAMNGEFFKSSWPRLHASMPGIDLPDREGSLTACRLDLTLALLRDCGHLQLLGDWDDPYLIKVHLAAGGDLAGALNEGDAALGRFPAELRLRHADTVICAQTLGEALAEQSVGLRSFGDAILRMIAAAGGSSWHRAPVQVAMSGLLPGLLRGEAQLGLNGDRAVAVRFTPVGPSRSLTRHELAERCRAVSLPTHAYTRNAAGESSEREDDWGSVANRVRQKWRARKIDPVALSSRHFPFNTRLDSPTLLSTLDRPLASVIPSREHRAKRDAEREAIETARAAASDTASAAL